MGGVEPSERLLRLAKRVLWVICPLYACVKGRSDGTGWDGNQGVVPPEVSVSVSGFHSVLKTASDVPTPAERVLTIRLCL